MRITQDIIHLDKTPTKRKAKCSRCTKKLSENLPRLYVYEELSFHQTKKYLCVDCATEHQLNMMQAYKSILKSSSFSIKQYKTLLKTKFKDACAVESL